MKNPDQHILVDADALFFYAYSAKTASEIANRKNISGLAKKYGITITFHNGECVKSAIRQDSIDIFQVSGRKNQSFFRHLRNAFAHLYIEIRDGRCTLLDWNPYKNGVQQKFSVSAITMNGDVDYSAFRTLLEDFFKQKQQPKNKKNEKNNN